MNFNEYKVSYYIKCDGIAFESPRGVFQTFEIINATTAKRALRIAELRVIEYNEDQIKNCEHTMAIPDIKSIADIVRL